MVALSQVEGAAEVRVQARGTLHGGHAGAQPQAGELALERLACGQGGGVLVGRGRPHRRAVLGADVVAVAVEVGGVVVLPEDPQQGLAARPADGGVVGHPHGLGVTGGPGAHLLVGGVGRGAAHVADGGDHHPVLAPQYALHAPEAAARQVDDLGALRPGAVQGCAQDHVVTGGGQERGLPAGQDRAACRRGGAGGGGARGVSGLGAARAAVGVSGVGVSGGGAARGAGRAAGAHSAVTSRILAVIWRPLGAS